MNGTEQPKNLADDRFATSARQAWLPPAALALKLRSFARRQVLSWANRRWNAEQSSFVRCLYGHAVFPEHRGELRKIIRTLKNQGEFIDTQTLTEIIQSGGHADGKYYHISFDDGFANVFEEGGPVFADEQVPYSVFISTDLIGASYEKMEHYNNQRLKYGMPLRTMTWDDVRACAASGGEIGCHTHTHARLSDISNDAQQLAIEIRASKEKIEAEIGQQCSSFAWPFGKYSDIDDVALDYIRDCGFNVCFSAERGRVEPQKTDLFQVPRHQVEFHWPTWENLLWARGYRE